MFLSNGSLLADIPRLISDFRFRHALHSKLAMSFVVFTMAFTLIFPTFASALAGYSANVDVFVITTEGNYVPFSSFEFAQFIISDGRRIGLGDDYVVTNAVVRCKYKYFLSSKFSS